MTFCTASFNLADATERKVAILNTVQPSCVLDLTTVRHRFNAKAKVTTCDLPVVFSLFSHLPFQAAVRTACGQQYFSCGVSCYFGDLITLQPPKITSLPCMSSCLSPETFSTRRMTGTRLQSAFLSPAVQVVCSFPGGRSVCVGSRLLFLTPAVNFTQRLSDMSEESSLLAFPSSKPDYN